MKPAGANEEFSLPLAERIAYLIAGYISGKLTEEEHYELDEWVEASEANMRLFEELTDEDKLEAAQHWFNTRQADKARQQQILASIKEQAGLRKPKRRLSPWLIAASVLFLSVSVYVWMVLLPSKNTNARPLATTNHQEAVLTLGDGRIVFLDDAANGQLALEGNTRIIKNDSTLIYTNTATNATVQTNTLATPRGGQYRVQLPDGSTVWLNAASSLRYPTRFTDSMRSVELEGEGYFEVARNPAKPFVVHAQGMTIQVLGTHFTVQAYKEDSSTSATLVEGSVAASYGGVQKQLKPGEAAIVQGGRLSVVQADTEDALDWKNNLFVFRNAPIENVLHTLGRWYDVATELRGKIGVHFTTTVNRGEKIERVLQLLEATGGVRFKLEGQKLIATPS